MAARVEAVSGRAGLSVRLDEAHHYDVEIGGGVVGVVARIGPLRQRIAEYPVPPGPLTLVVDIRTDDVPPPTATDPDRPATGAQAATGVRAAGPDVIAFSAEGPEGTLTLAELDGRYLSTQVAAGFTGRVIGMYVTEGSAAFDWFDYRPGHPRRPVGG